VAKVCSDESLGQVSNGFVKREMAEECQKRELQMVKRPSISDMSIHPLYGNERKSLRSRKKTCVPTARSKL